MAYWRYVEPQSTTHCAKRQAERAWRLPRFRQGRAPNVTLTHAARSRTKIRAMFARNADELAGLHGFE